MFLTTSNPLYGLRDGGHYWYRTLRYSVRHDLDLSNIYSDLSLYFNHYDSYLIGILATYFADNMSSSIKCDERSGMTVGSSSDSDSFAGIVSTSSGVFDSMVALVYWLIVIGPNTSAVIFFGNVLSKVEDVSGCCGGLL